ncbi:MAG: 5'-nucleotidase, lipoprotein e(P4) family, partial [Lysobacter sp.]
MRQRVAIPTLLACALALAGCQHTGALQAPATTAPAATPADDNLNAVLWMQASAEYDAAAAQTYRAAIAGLDAALADPAWDALVPSERAN